MTITATRFRAWDDNETLPEAKKQKIVEAQHTYKVDKIDTPSIEDKHIEEITEEDLMLGAYMLQHMNTYCENCGTFETWMKSKFVEY